MERISMIKIAWFFLLALSACNCNPLPHIIGGGQDTDISLLPQRQQNGSPRWLRAALSDLKFVPSVDNNDATVRNTENMLDTVPVAGPVVPQRSAEDRFLRGKRSANCPMSDRIPEMISQLNLSATEFIGLNPQDSTTPAPTTENLQCPNGNAGITWWGTRTETNLLSNCPWNYTLDDFGEDYFPRYVLKAQCICESCIQANALGCEEMKQKINVFHRKGCKAGVALLEKVEREINVGCFCKKADPPTTRPTVNTSSLSS